ncbi:MULTISPECIES: hypothetical protein [Bacillaceae]|uniref:Uncharacterized protein n=1 Tax=Alkalicoccobacillus plakortidis TaxID=444060 RepID=A0A9D5DU84_9BACI|nr:MULTISPECIES: hypothetical protein [Bacillaceae]KQL57240.1 hypothetical protein AN965_09840 [Alkalicoccobacillus plakortidis]
MGNLIKSGSFDSMRSDGAQIGSLVYLDADKTKIRISKGQVVGQKCMTYYFPSITHGSVYRVHVLARKYSGAPRVWFEFFDINTNRILNTNPNWDYVEIDDSEDLRLYTLRVTPDHPAIKVLALKFGFFNSPTLGGEAEFHEPFVTVESSNYDGKMLESQVIAMGIVGYDAGRDEWGAVRLSANSYRSVTHGIESMSWDKETKLFTIRYKHANVFRDEDSPTPIGTAYTRGKIYYGSVPSRLLIPILHSTGTHECVYWFADKDGIAADPQELGENAFISLEVKQ